MLLRHGTTRRRAEAILKNGPDPTFREPGSQEQADGFYAVSDSNRPPVDGTPECYAKRKAAIFRNEGEPAILEFELPDEFVRVNIVKGDKPVPGKAWDAGVETCFDLDSGLPQLVAEWSKLSKRVIGLPTEALDFLENE